MTARRIIYIALLIGAALLHFAYGQYATHFILLFLLLAPVFSVLITLPAAIRARVTLTRGADVLRGRETGVGLSFDTFGLLPPEGWSAVVSSKNLFTGSEGPKHKVRLMGQKRYETEFPVDSSEIGSIRYTIKRAYIYDYLGLVPIPVRKDGYADVTVLPDKEQPVPEPDLLEASAMALKPKPQGFAEEHELRPYHDGDPLNLVHWKLTAKYDSLILREPQEGVRRPIVLVLDIPILYEDHRSVLEQFSYLSDMLLAQQISYTVDYDDEQVIIGSENEYEEFIKRVLSRPMKTERSGAMFKTTRDELAYRISPGGRRRK